MNKIIEELKKFFSSPNSDYHSGVNDGMYALNEFLKGNNEMCIIEQLPKEAALLHRIEALKKLSENESVGSDNKMLDALLLLHSQVNSVILNNKISKVSNFGNSIVITIGEGNKRSKYKISISKMDSIESI